MKKHKERLSKMNIQELENELVMLDKRWYRISQRLLISIVVCLVMISGLIVTYLVTNYSKQYSFTVQLPVQQEQEIN